MDIHKVYPLFQKYFRSKRMRKFEKQLEITNQTTILDVGGSQYNWQFIKSEPKITVLNLSKPADGDWDPEKKNFTFEAGDATQMPYKNKCFDIAYSNSVIEHLYTWENQQKFASEVMRVGKAIYVQSPAKEFFMEPHWVTPFIHWLPLKWQSKLARNFTVWGLITKPSQENIDNFLAERRLLNYKEFKVLFPECKIEKEKFLFFTKSYIALKV